VLGLGKQRKTEGVVGVDIEAGSVAAAELRTNGSVELVGAAVEPLPPGSFHEGEVVDPDGVAAVLKSLFGQHKLSKRVRLGVGNQRVVVRTVRLPAIEDPKEMEAAIRFQAQEQIPMPLDQAILEHQVVGGVPAEEGGAPQVDVIVIAARRDMVSALVEPIRAAGLEPVGVDLSAFGMIRALAGAGAEAADGPAENGGGEPQQPDPAAATDPGAAVLYCNVGDVMNLAVARGRSCLFTRVATAGMGGIAARLAGERALSLEHATQWLAHTGLEQPLEQIEGDPEALAAARRALEDGVSSLVDELSLSLDYYAAQESAIAVQRIVLAGHGSAIPGLAERMRGGFGLPISVARPAALAGYDDAVAARLTLPYGIALEG
jgi:type IV pilus assembly protein PilM